MYLKKKMKNGLDKPDHLNDRKIFITKFRKDEGTK